MKVLNYSDIRADKSKKGINHLNFIDLFHLRQCQICGTNMTDKSICDLIKWMEDEKIYLHTYVCGYCNQNEKMNWDKSFEIMNFDEAKASLDIPFNHNANKHCILLLKNVFNGTNEPIYTVFNYCKLNCQFKCKV